MKFKWAFSLSRNQQAHFGANEIDLMARLLTIHRKIHFSEATKKTEKAHKKLLSR